MNTQWTIRNAFAYKDGKFHPHSSFKIQNGKLENISNEIQEAPSSLLSLDLKGLPMLPAFINAHEKSLGTFYAYQGMESPYQNWLEWENEMRSSTLFRDKMLLEPIDLYRLSSYRNILSGVCTMLDFSPAFVREPMYDPVFPSIVKNIGLAHSISSYGFDWGKGIQKEHELAVKNDMPFCIHINEGFDGESRESLEKLDGMGALNEYTVLMNGVSLSEWDLDKIAEKKAHIVFAPRASHCLYNKIPPIIEAHKRNINISIGTDAAMRGSINLLDEVNCIYDFLQRTSPGALGALDLLDCVTVNAAKALRIPNIASLKNNCSADCIILRKVTENESFFTRLSPEDIFLVIKNGLPVFGDNSLGNLFKYFNITVDKMRIGEKNVLIAQHGNEGENGIKKLVSRTSLLGKFHFLPIG